jgi:hypothetical protein
MPEAFQLKVDGRAADARRLECHFQTNPYPGGHHYELAISDADTLAYAKTEFGHGIHRRIGELKSRKVLSFLDGMKPIKIGRENPPQFWANSIDDLELSDERLVLRGVCSPHVGGSAG